MTKVGCDYVSRYSDTSMKKGTLTGWLSQTWINLSLLYLISLPRFDLSTLYKQGEEGKNLVFVLDIWFKISSEKLFLKTFIFRCRRTGKILLAQNVIFYLFYDKMLFSRKIIMLKYQK